MKDLNEIIKQILIEYPEARDDDFKVIGYVIKTLQPNAMQLTFGQVLWNHVKLNLPSFETIRRTRQKIQHDVPELRGELYLKRMEKQAEYIDQFSEVV